MWYSNHHAFHFVVKMNSQVDPKGTSPLCGALFLTELFECLMSLQLLTIGQYLKHGSLCFDEQNLYSRFMFLLNYLRLFVGFFEFSIYHTERISCAKEMNLKFRIQQKVKKNRIKSRLQYIRSIIIILISY